MTIIGSTSLAQLDINMDHRFITTVTSRDGCSDLTQLIAVFHEHRAVFMDLLSRRGVLLFRGFSPPSHEAFQELITHGMGMAPWNGFNLKGMPAFASNWLRRYTEGLMGSGDYRRYLSTNTVQLGPVESAVQGPHVEGGGSPTRARYLALCCFQPAEHQAETGMVDLHEVFEHLSPEMQDKYVNALNRFCFITHRRLHALDRLILSRSPVKIIDMLHDGRAKLATAPTPAVCEHPVTGEFCLQPWAFARNTNGHVHSAAIEAFAHRGELKRCSNADGTNYLWDLCDIYGHDVAWSESEQRALFDDIFRRCHLHPWQQGDIALVDNVRIGHWRMNGVQGQRKLVQIQVASFCATEHPARPERRQARHADDRRAA